ncbi:MAG TPA: methyltransferase domain-containing protein [Candidatus Eisenbacteria bacterium]|nr:methyltransferase domain-containing protein [Candidatus Eisenbacteria bacterium]
MATAPDESAYYDARWGYRRFDARRYEARRYGSFGRRVNHRLLERALKKGLAGVRRGGIVLDAPCGTGILADFLRGQGFRVLGADISPAMLEVAKERGPVIGHVRADLERPPLRPGSVDAVVSTRFLMHLPPEIRPRVLGGMARLANGPVVATVCHPYTYKTFGRAVRRALGRKVKQSPRLTRAELEQEVAAAGLRLERVIPVLPLLSEVWVIVVRTTPGSA